MIIILILGVDTASKISSIAVAEANLNTSDVSGITDFIVLSEIYSGGGIPHSENVSPMVDFALKTAGAELRDIDVFAVTSGPGSFTGIRIGVSVVKGLAYGGENNCIGVSSLHVLAYNLKGFSDLKKTIAVPVIDARRKQVYNAVFSLSEKGGIEYIEHDRIITVTELEEELNRKEKFADSDIIFVGDGADMCYNEISLERNLKKRTGDILCCPSAASVCRLAAHELRRGVKAIHPRILSPSYLIKTQAEKEYAALR